MTWLEFLDDIPFNDVYIHSVIQAPDGRRMSKSLGTGIDPLELIDSHGADALRFGLLAMSSSQDVRFSEAKVQQGRDLANKLWNASRLILLNAGDADARSRRRETVEDRWILSRLERTRRARRRAPRRLRLRPRRARALPLRLLGALRLVPRDRQAAALRRSRRRRRQRRRQPAARARPDARDRAPADAVRDRGDLELPAGSRGELIVAPVPEADPARFDAAAEAEVAAAIELTRSLRRWRELAGVSPGAVAAGADRRRGPPARAPARPPRVRRRRRRGGDRRGRRDRDPAVRRPRAGGGRRPDRGAARASSAARSSGPRASSANEKFVANAPADVVDAEREKLERYRAELEELG